MMDYKLNEEELIASFRPSEPKQNNNLPPRPLQHQPPPPNHPPMPQHHPIMNNVHHYRPSQVSQPPSRSNQPLVVRQEQRVYQMRQNRPSGPPVKFNYHQHNQNPQIANTLQRQSIVRPVVVANNQVPVNVVQQMQPIQSTQPPQQIAVNAPIPVQNVQNTSPPNMNGQPISQRAASGPSEVVVSQQGGQLVNGQSVNQRPVASQQKQIVEHQNASYQEGYPQYPMYPYPPPPPPYMQHQQDRNPYMPYPNSYPNYPYYPQQYPPYPLPPYQPYYPMHPPHQIPPPLSYEEFKSLPPQEIHRLWMQHQQLQQQLVTQHQPRMKNYNQAVGMQQQYQQHAQQNYGEEDPNYPRQNNVPQGQQQEVMNNQEYPEQYSEQYGYGQQGGYQYPPEYYQQQQGFTEYPPEYYQAAQGQSTLWQQRFFYLYEKFQTFFEKYEVLDKQGAFLADLFLKVDSQEEWLALKQKYDSLVERMNEVKQENAMILQEMQDNIQQNLKIENGASIKQEAGRVWQHRYHQLLEQYQSLSHHYAELQSSSMAHNDMDQNERISMMNEKYSRLQAEYNHVVQELQNSQNAMQLREEHEDLLKYTQQLQGYIEQLESQNNNLMRGMKTSVDGSKMMQDSEVNQKLVEKQNEIKNLSHIIVTLEEKVKSAEQNRPKSNLNKDERTNELESQIQEMTLYCNEVQQKLSMKQYEINGLNDKLGYMEEQLHIKQQQVAAHSKLLQERLAKIQQDLSKKTQALPPVQSQPAYLNSFSFEQDYENRIKEYQRSIQSKNNEIKSLEERITQSETLARKISIERSAAIRQLQDKMQATQEEVRRKLQEKDAKIRMLEQDIKDKEYENQRKYQEKDNSLRALEAQMRRVKEEIEVRLTEKDTIIKGLRDTTQRISNELKDKNSEISRIKSPTITSHLHSPNQSFVAQTFRHDEQIKMLAEQLQRRNDEIGKLKKERDSRNKQIKDLENEYEKLQQQNNKRRIEINNLKRQSVTIENLQLEADNLRNTLSKRNQDITELKNSLFEKDRVRMELQSTKRQLEKQAELSRLKNREIEQLTQRNYELEEKIRQKEFKLPVKQEINSQKNITEELQQIKEDLRRKEIEVNRLKAENDELQRTLRRESEELESVKLRYPNKLKSLEQQLSETKLKLTMLEKKYTAIQSRAKEAEQLGRKIKANAIEQQNKELGRMQENFTKHTSRLEDQNQSLKQKIRTYEIKVHELQIEADSYASRVKELEAFKDEHAKKLVNLNERLDFKEEQLKNVKQKTTSQVLKFRKKESRVMQLEAALKSRDEQARESQKHKESLRIQLRTLKKQFEDYKQQVLDQMEYSTHKEMQNLNKQLNEYQSKFALHNYNFDFKSKDKKANQVFQRTVIYQLKEENDFLRRELQGRGSSISLEKMRINQMQQEVLLKSKSLNRPETQPAHQQLEFYRQKNKELEERVNSHIAVNKNLKQRLEQLATNKNDGDFNKELMLEQLQRKVIQLQAVVRRLQQQNEEQKQNIGTRERNHSSNQLYELQINDLNRTITQISLHRESLIEEIKVVVSQRNKFESQLHELEKNAGRNENKISVQQQEIQRLKEVTRAQKSNSLQSDLKLKMEGLMSQLAQKETALSEYHVKASHFESESINLQKTLRYLENQLSQTKQNQLQSNNEEHQKLKNKINALQATINSLEGSIDIMRERISQLEGEAEFYRQQAFQQKGQRAIPEETYYFLELLRSNYLQLQSLAGEISIESEVMAILAERIGQNCRRGLESCQYLHQLFAN